MEDTARGDAGVPEKPAWEAHEALYAELLDIGCETAISWPDAEERQRAIERLGRGWAEENFERDAMWARMARVLARSEE